MNKQQEYEHRRHMRILGLAINQALHGVQNIQAYVKDDAIIAAKAEVAFDLLKTIEALLLKYGDVYASLIPRGE